MRTLFHLSPVENRDSILRHGLDPRRMGAAPGLANSTRRELDGVYVCPHRDDVDWFLTTMGPSHPAGLDLWAIEAADDEVLQTGTGNFEYLPVPVPPARVRLAETFAPPYPDPFASAPNALAGENGATIEWEDDDEDGSAIVAQIGDGVAWETGEDRPPQPLPDWLAPIVDGALRDVTGTGAAEAGLVATHLLDEHDPTWADVELHDAAGRWIAHFGFPIEPRGATAAVAAATALQRTWIERPQVEGTLHPPCPGHPHAAVAVELDDDAAWWTCPADGRRLARVGALR